MMTSRRRWTWSAVAGFAGLLAIALSASNDIWWPDYAGGPDSSRFFRSKRINKSNVNRLAVAWTYPFGETGSNPIVVRGTIYGRGRNGAIVALDAKTGKEIWIHDGMKGMTARGMNYWESRDGKDRRLIFSDERLPAGDRRGDRKVHPHVRHRRRRRSARGPRAAIPRLARIQSGTPGRIFENLILLGSATGEGYMSPPGDLRAYDVITGNLVWQFHTVPHPGEFGYETWPKDAWKYVGGAIHGARSRSTTGAASRTSRRDRRPTTTTARIGRARISFRTVWSRSTRERANGSGISRASTTISGTSTTTPAPQLTHDQA